jgi:DDE superfamily endonuclease
MRPPRSRTWGRRGITPVIRVRGGGTGRVSVAGLACCRPGHRSRLIYRLHRYRGRKDETKAFTWTGYRDLLIAAHRQLPGGVVVLIWDNLNVHRRAELRAFTEAQAWLRVFRLPAYAPDLNPVEMGLPQCKLCRSPLAWLPGSLSVEVPIGVPSLVQLCRLW